IQYCGAFCHNARAIVADDRHLSEKIETLIKNGNAANKAEFARRALEHYIEEQAIFDVLRAEQEVRGGKILSGDIDELAAKL
ncbi:hypothetical protein HY621_02880, partial [Candidatus Uhrbacteria bacterium]|nr:hypothetical protein [Candidatus Uhrbacteria bacterium]